MPSKPQTWGLRHFHLRAGCLHAGGFRTGCGEPGEREPGALYRFGAGIAASGGLHLFQLSVSLLTVRSRLYGPGCTVSRLAVFWERCGQAQMAQGREPHHAVFLPGPLLSGTSLLAFPGRGVPELPVVRSPGGLCAGERMLLDHPLSGSSAHWTAGYRRGAPRNTRCALHPVISWLGNQAGTP